MERFPSKNITVDGIFNLTTTNTTGTRALSTFREIKLTLYVVIFLISAIGNSLVCIVILRRRRMKTVTNYFILNLAIADLALTCICIPFDIPVQEMNYTWPYGAFMCKILYPLQTLTLFASVFTLTAVSLTRYWAIVHPLRQQLSVSHAKRIIIAIWIIAVIPVSPYMYVLNHQDGSLACVENWVDPSMRKVYTAGLFVFQYILPLSIIAGAYIGIGIELHTRQTRRDHGLRDAQAEETRKVLRMLKVVTLAFALFVLPTNIMWIWLDFGEADKHYNKFWELVAFCNIITFANSAANPICYTVLNETYRKEFKSYLLRSYSRTSTELSSFRNRVSQTSSNFASFKKRTLTMSSSV